MSKQNHIKLIRISFTLLILGIRIEHIRSQLSKGCEKYPLTSLKMLKLNRKFDELSDRYAFYEAEYLSCEITISKCEES